MHHPMSRRNFLNASALALPLAHVSGLQQEGATASAVADTFPQNGPTMVREAVVAAHGNVKRLRELVDAHPALARAAYDWGFGDWEDCLGAASHVGNREIAEYLIGKGARPTLFSAVMLGQLDTVKAFIALQPGCQRIPGPHSISLLAHAKAGGAGAAAVFEFLDRLGDAGGPKTEPLADEEKAALAGAYVFGRGAADRFDITIDKGSVMIQRPGQPYARGLLHLGERTFHPMGASAVRVRFAGSGATTTLTVTDGEVVVNARRS